MVYQRLAQKNVSGQEKNVRISTEPRFCPQKARSDANQQENSGVKLDSLLLVFELIRIWMRTEKEKQVELKNVFWGSHYVTNHLKHERNFAQKQMRQWQNHRPTAKAPQAMKQRAAPRRQLG